MLNVKTFTAWDWVTFDRIGWGWYCILREYGWDGDRLRGFTMGMG